MAKFQRITRLKKKKVRLREDVSQTLESFAKFVTESQDEIITGSDIVGTILMEAKSDKRIRFPSRPVDKELSLNLPETAWDNLSEIAGRHQVDEKEVLEKLIQVQTRDKSFQEWLSSKNSQKA